MSSGVKDRAWRRAACAFWRRTHRVDLDALLRRLLGGQVETEHLIGQLLHHRRAGNTWNGVTHKDWLWGKKSFIIKRESGRKEKKKKKQQTIEIVQQMEAWGHDVDEEMEWDGERAKSSFDCGLSILKRQKRQQNKGE